MYISVSTQVNMEVHINMHLLSCVSRVEQSSEVTMQISRLLTVYFAAARTDALPWKSWL